MSHFCDEPLLPTGQVGILGKMTFKLDTDPATDPPVFTLTCASTGVRGPIVSWRRDGTILSNDSTHCITSKVTNSETFIYTHSLRVTGRLVGEYELTVSNSKIPSGNISSLTVVGKKDNICGEYIYV